MGFCVSEELKIERFGVSVAGAYVTIKATYVHQKKGSSLAMYMPMQNNPLTDLPYNLSCKIYVYASNDNTLSPLEEENFNLALEAVPANPIATLYEAIKAQRYAGKTMTDDL